MPPVWLAASHVFHLPKQVNYPDGHALTVWVLFRFVFFSRHLRFLASDRSLKSNEWQSPAIILPPRIGGTLTPSNLPPKQETCRNHPPTRLWFTSDGNLKMEKCPQLYAAVHSSYGQLNLGGESPLCCLRIVPLLRFLNLSSRVTLNEEGHTPSKDGKQAPWSPILRLASLGSHRRILQQTCTGPGLLTC